jgi:hypothetical protein
MLDSQLSFVQPNGGTIVLLGWEPGTLGRPRGKRQGNIGMFPSPFAMILLWSLFRSDSG